MNLGSIVGEGLLPESSVGVKKPGASSAHMATADHDRQRQAAHRQYKLRTVVEFVAGS